MSIEDRIAAGRLGRAAQTEAAIVDKKLRQGTAKLEVAVQPAVQPAATTETLFDIANNSVAKVMDRSDLSDKGKLEAVVEFLSAKDNDYVAAQKHFAQFEVYFTYAQSKRTQVSEDNIQRLMDELAEGQDRRAHRGGINGGVSLQ
jgi:hypothetical protein